MDVIANTAFSLTLSGNSGISPFLTMFLIGMAGRIQPEYLKLDETMEKIMTSWPSLTFWSIMTILETIGKCVPVIDEIIDSVEVFIVPILSTLGTFSAFGSFEGSFEDSADDGRKLRGLSTVSTSSIANGINTFFRIILVCFGIVLAICIHFVKMLIRLFGEGCLTQCITILEATTVCTSVLVSIFVRQFSIFVAACLLLAAGYGGKRKWEKWQDKKKQQEQEQKQEQMELQQTTSTDGQENNTTAARGFADEYVKMDDTEPGSAQV